MYDKSSFSPFRLYKIWDSNMLVKLDISIH